MRESEGSKVTGPVVVGIRWQLASSPRQDFKVMIQKTLLFK